MLLVQLVSSTARIARGFMGSHPTELPRCIDLSTYGLALFHHFAKHARRHARLKPARIYTLLLYQVHTTVLTFDVMMVISYHSAPACFSYNLNYVTAVDKCFESSSHLQSGDGSKRVTEERRSITNHDCHVAEASAICQLTECTCPMHLFCPLYALYVVPLHSKR